VLLRRTEAEGSGRRHDRSRRPGCRYPKIAKRHRWSEEQLQAFLDNLAHLAILTPGVLTLAVITEDPPDDRYLECAVEGEAAYIVSGDRLLLGLRVYRGIPTP
jgi:predicted nucleic acid-binding protein